jgi:hypothetical protein
VRALRAGSRVPERSTRLQAVEVVDAALTLACRRRLFTADETLELLSGVLIKVDDPVLHDVLASTSDAAERLVADAGLVDRSQVVDVLLDMRLALAG